MKAIIVREPGDENGMELREVARPELRSDKVRIRVSATAVNRADLMQRRGFYPPPQGASEVLGLECAGRVSEIGSGVPQGTHVKIGAPVMALLAGGGYAEEVSVHHSSVMPIPACLDEVSAGGFPEVYLTVYLNVFQLAGLQAGQALLVHGGGSGIGTAAIQLAKEAGTPCYVTAGSDEKCRRCVELGATAAINYNTEDFVERIADLTAGRGVDVILDSIGGAYLERNLSSLALGGRLVIIGMTGGMSANLNLAALLTRRLQVIGSTLRARPVEEKAEIVASFFARFGAALEAGRLRVVVDRVLPLRDAAEAHRIVEASTHFGKIILRV